MASSRSAWGWRYRRFASLQPVGQRTAGLAMGGPGWASHAPVGHGSARRGLASLWSPGLGPLGGWPAAGWLPAGQLAWALGARRLAGPGLDSWVLCGPGVGWPRGRSAGLAPHWRSAPLGLGPLGSSGQGSVRWRSPFWGTAGSCWLTARSPSLGRHGLGSRGWLGAGLFVAGRLGLWPHGAGRPGCWGRAAMDGALAGQRCGAHRHCGRVPFFVGFTTARCAS